MTPPPLPKKPKQKNKKATLSDCSIIQLKIIVERGLNFLSKVVFFSVHYSSIHKNQGNMLTTIFVHVFHCRLCN